MAFASVSPTPAPAPAPPPRAPQATPPGPPPVLPTAAPTRAPAPGDRAVAAPALPVERRTLPGGVRLIVERRPGAPRTAIEIAWPGGVAAEPSARAGGTAVLAAAITAACLPLAVDDGGALTARAGRWHLAVRGTWPSVAWREGLRTAWSCPASARVGAALPGARDRVVRDAALAAASPAQRAAALAARARWGADPLGLDAHRTGGVAALSIDALRAQQAGQLATAPIVVVVGDVTVDELAGVLTDAGPWREGAPAAPRPGGPPPPIAQVFAEHPSAGAAVAIALPGLPAADPDRAALDVLAAILAAPTGPLADARAGGALTIAVPDGAERGGLVALLTGPAPLADRVAAVRDALAALAAAGPDPGAVAAARADLLAEQDRPEVRAAALARAALTGAADPRVALAAVDVAAVARVAAALLRWDQATLATVQPPDHTPAVDRLMQRPGRRASRHALTRPRWRRR